MATPLDQAAPMEEEQEDQAPQGGGEVSKEDVEIVTRLGIQILSKGGLDQIKQALTQSNDPAQVIGTFLVQVMSQILEQVSSQIDLDPRAFLAKGGFLDHILDYIETKLGYPEEFSDQIYAQTLEVLKAAAMNPQGQGGQPQQGQQPQQPMGGMPNG